ncbi:unnamed protein product [Caenorhabditis sp. 36 PRJEB53466]|nr:unnamed protein product [Caenorhabditis sp. 36 PRJEB53466]
MDQAWLQVIDRMEIEDAIRMRRVSPKMDLLVSKSLRSRKHLDIERDCPSAVHDPSAIASVIAQCSHNLRSIDLKIRRNQMFSTIPSNVEIRRKVMVAIIENSNKLKKLHIDRCRLTTGAIASFGDLPDTIEEVSITNSLIDCSEWEVATIIRKAFEMFFTKCRKLKFFEVSGRCLSSSHFHVDPSILRLMSDTVEHLAIAGSNLRINTLAFLKTKRLKTLILQRSFISPTDLEYIVAMANTITHLDLSFSVNLKDCQEISKLKNLKHLSLTNNRDSVLDDSVALIARECLQLEELCLNDCSNLTPYSLIYLGELRNLYKLSLSGVPNVDDSVCQQIARCTKINFLELNLCRKVQKRGLQCLLSNLTALQHLEVIGIRDYSHQLLTTQLTHLKTIVCDDPIVRFSFTLPSAVPVSA